MHYAKGSWHFRPSGDGGTHIEWTYAFQPKRFGALLVRVLIAPAWRRYMRKALAATIREVDRQTAAVG